MKLKKHITQSKNAVPIRLPQKSWEHILDKHPDISDCLPEILQTIEDPDFIREGSGGSLLAVRLYESSPLNGKFMVVAYIIKTKTDGFITTAYPTRKSSIRKRILWSRQNFP